MDAVGEWAETEGQRIGDFFAEAIETYEAIEDARDDAFVDQWEIDNAEANEILEANRDRIQEKLEQINSEFEDAFDAWYDAVETRDEAVV